MSVGESENLGESVKPERPKPNIENTKKTDKNGRKLSRDEINYIRENVLYKNDQELADILKCAPETVAKHRVRMGLRRNKYLDSAQKKHKEKPGESIDLPGLQKQPFDMLSELEQKKLCELKLTTSPRWRSLEKTLNTDEMHEFLESWVNYYLQFRGELTATEETQLMQLIQYEVMMERALINKREVFRAVEKRERLITAEMRLDESKRDNTKIIEWETEITTLRTSEAVLSKEYLQLQEKHSRILENLKATRDQRIREIEDKSKNFFALVKYVQRKENQEREARFMGLAKKAMDKEKKRFGALHTYMDGSIDRILLNEETVSQTEDDIDLDKDEDDGENE